MSGYVRLYRDLIAHPAFRNDAEAMAFAWLFARAAWKPCRVRYKGHAIALDRGQVAISIRDMAEALDRDKAWVERLFKRLKSETMIETRAETGVSVVTICNYAKFQPKADTSKTPSETPEETDARQGRDTEQEREEEKEEKNPPTPRAGGRAPKMLLPKDWVLPPVADLPPKARACAEQWPLSTYETHGEAFVSYWHGEGKMKADWRGTWANRVIALHSQVMRDQKFGNAPPVASAAHAKPMNDADRAAYLVKLNDNPMFSATRQAPAATPRTGNTGPPRAIGDLIHLTGTH